MKPQLYHYPRPGRNYRRALLTASLLALSAAISIAAIVLTYVIFR